MRKLNHLQTLILIIISLLFCASCQKQPEASFTTDTITISAGESVQFTDQSLNEPLKWSWIFEGGSPSFSETQDPLVTYNDVGTFDVTLEATNRGGTGMILRENYITVEEPTTDVTFNNTTYKEIKIVVNYIEKTIESEGSVTYYDLEGSSVSYYAETSGKTTDGTQVGELLTWDYTFDLTGGTMERDLFIGTDYYFLTFTNSGTHTLNPLEVEQGPGDIITENIVIPNNGTEYNIGYYEAWEQTVVRAYYEDSPTYYSYWENISFPGTINQTVHLTAYLKKGTGVDESREPFEMFFLEAEPAREYRIRQNLDAGSSFRDPNN